MSLDPEYIAIQKAHINASYEAGKRPQRRHTPYVCKCNSGYCQFCDGGLCHCTVCGGFEGTLTTECPGVRLFECTLDDVYDRLLDFFDGQWQYQFMQRMVAYINAKEPKDETEKLPGA